MNVKRIRVEVTGRVQGVGFRPTVYRHAAALGLSGFVRNTPSGVVIEAEGDVQMVDRFVAQLQAEPPRQARIETLRINDLPAYGLSRRSGFAEGDAPAPFEIKPSGRSGNCLSGLPRGIVRSQKPPVRVSLHQLHKLRAAIQHYPRVAL